MNGLLFFVLSITLIYFTRNLWDPRRRDEIKRTKQVKALLQNVKKIRATGSNTAVRKAYRFTTRYGQSIHMTPWKASVSELDAFLEEETLRAIKRFMVINVLPNSIESANADQLIKQATELAKGLPIAAEVALFRQDAGARSTHHGLAA